MNWKIVMMDKLVGLFVVAVLLLANTAFGQIEEIPKSDARYYGAQISELISVPEDQLDFGRLTLTFNKMVDPSIDVDAGISDIERMATDIRRMAGPNADQRQLLTALRTYVYEPGEWNAHKPFEYDQSDPVGAYIPNKLLPNYIASRKGNCVSMPVLFVVLGDRLGLNLTLSTAPNHVFVHYTAPDGTVANLETTSGAHPSRDAWIRQNFKMTDEAVENGMYLKQLSRRQTAAIMAGVVLENALDKKEYGYAIHISDALLEVFPEYDLALIGRGLAFQAMLHDNFINRYPNLSDIPESQHFMFNHLAMNADRSFSEVEALGYITPD